LRLLITLLSSIIWTRRLVLPSDSPASQAPHPVQHGLEFAAFSSEFLLLLPLPAGFPADVVVLLFSLVTRGVSGLRQNSFAFFLFFPVNDRCILPILHP